MPEKQPGKAFRIGERIQSLIDALGSSQSEVARRARMTPGTLNNVLTGKRSPNVETLSRIATALNASLDALVFGQQRRLPPLPSFSSSRKKADCSEYRLKFEESARRMKDWRNAAMLEVLDHVAKLGQDKAARKSVADLITFCLRWHLPDEPPSKGTDFAYGCIPNVLARPGGASVEDLTEGALLPHLQDLTPRQLALLRQYLLELAQRKAVKEGRVVVAPPPPDPALDLFGRSGAPQRSRERRSTIASRSPKQPKRR
jgi:transcriptional regulator with XRE-family HTH domain